MKQEVYPQHLLPAARLSSFVPISVSNAETGSGKQPISEMDVRFVPNCQEADQLRLRRRDCTKLGGGCGIIPRHRPAPTFAGSSFDRS